MIVLNASTRIQSARIVTELSEGAGDCWDRADGGDGSGEGGCGGGGGGGGGGLSGLGTVRSEKYCTKDW